MKSQPFVRLNSIFGFVIDFFERDSDGERVLPWVGSLPRWPHGEAWTKLKPGT